ncbi:MAG: hypothetical protein P8Y00_06575 [Deltaproteobacteria bacterium]
MMIIKIGGGSGINLKGIIADLAGVDERFLIVHGANALRDKLAEDLGGPKQVITSVKGYASVYSDENLIDVMMMAWQDKDRAGFFRETGGGQSRIAGIVA